jgi:hypothetical protein
VAVAQLVLVRSMSRVAVLAALLLLSACVSREVVYQRSLAAPHLSAFARHLPRSDFEQIAEVLSHKTRQSIADIYPGLKPNQVIVNTAFPNAAGPGTVGQFTLEKHNGRWYVISGWDEPVYTG